MDFQESRRLIAIEEPLKRRVAGFNPANRFGSTARHGRLHR